MPLDAWLPVGFTTPDGEQARLALHEGVDWQIFEAQGGGRILVAKETLVHRWQEAGLVENGLFKSFTFGGEKFCEFSCKSGHTLEPIADCKSPENKNEALAFAAALRATREHDAHSPLQDGIYVERISRLLPTYSLSAPVADNVMFGTWLTGGVPVSVQTFRRLHSLVGWMGKSHLHDVVLRAGFEVQEKVAAKKTDAPDGLDQQATGKFTLAGRPELELFINEHVIDIIENPARYKALGIDFPSAIILHGPPGCGKTFAVERLVDYLGWPSFQIEASSVASPYIHETSKKVAEIFEKAMQSSPSVLVIDEMEAFLTDRQIGAGSGQHHVEEVAEFLRRIPEAVKNNVLIIAMTNRIEMIDPAIQRRGRFDHVVKVGMASEEEVRSLLEKLVSELPKSNDVDVVPLAKRLQGRPLSDVAFVVREGARLAARSGKDKIDQTCLVQALESTPARGSEEAPARNIGFIWEETHSTKT